MATIEQLTDLSPSASEASTIGRKLRGWRIAALATGMLLFLVWLAPIVVAHSPLRNWLLSMAAGDLAGSVRAGGASFGWFSPVKVYDLEVRDAGENPVLQTPQIQVDRALWRLVTSATRIGRVRVERPSVNLVLTDSGSNLEELLAPWLVETDEPAADISAQVEILDGRISVKDEPSGRKWQIDKLRLALDVPQFGRQPIQMRLSGVVPAEARTGRLAVDLRLSHDRAEATLGQSRGECSLTTEALPLELVSAFARRVAPQVRLSGSSTSTLACRWESPAASTRELELHGTLGAEELRLAGLLPDDELRLNRISVPCQLHWHNGQLVVERLEADCDLGRAMFAGTLDMNASVTSSLRKQSYTLSGQIDLARLAAALPNTIRVREATQINAGTLSLSLTSQQQSDGLRWQGQVETSNLVATNRGQQITWEKPIVLTVAARNTQGGPVIEKLSCVSTFLLAEASGSLEQGQASATIDLNRLAAELGRFVDLGGAQLAGDGRAKLHWTRGGGNFEAAGDLQIQNLGLAWAGSRPWTEEQINATVTLAGLADPNSLREIRSATLKLESGLDHLTARLARPLATFDSQTSWPIEVQAQGRVERWWPRLALWLGPLESWNMAGDGELTASAAVSARECVLESSQCNIRQCRLTGPGMFIEDPAVRLVAQGRWEPEQGRLSLANTTLTTSAMTLAISQAALESQRGEAARITGKATWDGDLARVRRWFQDPSTPAASELLGRITGSMQLTHQQQVTSATIDAGIENLLVRSVAGTDWQEPQIRLIAEAAYQLADDTLKLPKLEVTSAALRGQAKGEVTQLTTARELILAGQIDYDWKQLQRVLRPWLGEGIQLGGRDVRQFSIRAPLGTDAPTGVIAASAVTPTSLDRLARLQGEFGLGWDWAVAYGFRTAQGSLQARAQDGLLRFAPVDLAVNDGRVRLQPVVRLSPGPVELSLASGRIVDQVQITPEMCAQALQYIAPALTGVTEASGKLSIDLEGIRVPVEMPARGDVAGRLTLHSIEIAPGPLVRELSLILGRPAPTKVAMRRESVVPFRMVDGRIYHQSIELLFPDVTIRTFGSVGLDKSLAIIAEMPVPEKWLPGGSAGTALRGRTIRLPIAGTLSQPKVDQQALRELTAQFARETAGDLLIQGLNKQLDRVLPRKQ